MQKILDCWPSAVIILIYGIGAAGFCMPGTAPLFASLTWVTLLLSFVLLIAFHEDKSANFWRSVLAVVTAGYLIEVIGVKTGVPFGHYTYGHALGFKLSETPLLIGINWFLLTYIGNAAGRSLFKKPLWSATAGAVLMTLFDLMIEPFAIHYGLWEWRASSVPIRNYASWFLIGLILNLVFQQLNPGLKNRTTIALGGSMAAFFLVVDWLTIWT